MRLCKLSMGAWVCVVGSMGTTALAAPPNTFDLSQRLRTQESIDRGCAFLARTQREDGAWEAFERPHPAITALAVKTLLQHAAYGPDHPACQRGVEFLLRFVQPDGGIYVSGEGMRNYHTSVALMALSATKNPKYQKTIVHGQHFLKSIMWDEGEGHERSSTFYGGQGYGRHKRPDLSNTQLMIEALHQSGLSPDDPVYQRALVFVSRCQMLDATNDQDLASGTSEGGFIYTPVGGGESKAGTEMDKDRPRLRSYGSMTYAGFKSLLYARVDRDDVRVRQAFRWIRKHYTLDHNPNMPGKQSKQGLYYYYHVFARALYAWDEMVIIDHTGVPRYWRTDLSQKLINLQQSDGSWVNPEDRWFEGNPHLVSAYAILALQTTLASTP